MPRTKPSPGKRKFVTPVIDELQRYVFYELVNAREWNRETIKHETIGPNRWRFTTGSHGEAKQVAWSIEYDGKALIVTSECSRFSIRQGLTFDMGNGSIIVGAQE